MTRTTTTSTRRVSRSGCLLAAAALLLVACQDSADEPASDPAEAAGTAEPADAGPDDGDTGTEQPDAEQPASEQPPAEEPAAEQPEQEPDGPADVPTVDELAAQPGEPIRVSYEFSYSGDPPVAGTVSTSIDGERVASRTDVDGMSWVMIGDGAEVVTCMHVGEWRCLAGEQPGVGDLPTDTALDDPAEGFGGWEFTGDDRIAGRDVACGTVPDGQVCFDYASGMPLLIVGSELEMRAVEVGAPDAGDFDPPAPVGS